MIQKEETRSTSSVSRPQAPAQLDVQMKAEYIFDLLLYHMYSTFGGFMLNIAGLSVIIIGGLRYFKEQTDLLVALGYLAFGIFLLCITPASLRLRANGMMKLPKYSGVLRYKFDDSGIEESMAGGFNHYGWSQVEKAVNTPKTISFYMQDSGSVLVFPKAAFTNDSFRDAMWYLSHNVVMGKIFIH